MHSFGIFGAWKRQHGLPRRGFVLCLGASPKACLEHLQYALSGWPIRQIRDIERLEVCRWQEGGWRRIGDVSVRGMMLCHAKGLVPSMRRFGWEFVNYATHEQNYSSLPRRKAPANEEKQQREPIAAIARFRRGPRPSPAPRKEVNQ